MPWIAMARPGVRGSTRTVPHEQLFTANMNDVRKNAAPYAVHRLRSAAIMGSHTCLLRLPLRQLVASLCGNLFLAIALVKAIAATPAGYIPLQTYRAGQASAVTACRNRTTYRHCSSSSSLSAAPHTCYFCNTLRHALRTTHIYSSFRA